MNANTNGMSGKGRKEVKSGGTGWFMFILKVGYFFFSMLRQDKMNGKTVWLISCCVMTCRSLVCWHSSLLL